MAGRNHTQRTKGNQKKDVSTMKKILIKGWKFYFILFLRNGKFKKEQNKNFEPGKYLK